MTNDDDANISLIVGSIGVATLLFVIDTTLTDPKTKKPPASHHSTIPAIIIGRNNKLAAKYKCLT